MSLRSLGLSEFTGERVIPGLVDDNLFNEHLARYRFAARFSEGAHVLDAGCGSGYGIAEFSQAASVTAFDVAAEAVAHARENFSRPGVRFLQASCDSLPFADASFDLLTAFEVIEHLERWPQLLTEAARVLRPSGVLLVSTPNQSYYAESRAAAGPNPFHCHEFEYAEFEAALYAVFPHVRLWTQNHAEAIVFAPAHPSGGTLDAPGNAAPETAHFFLAACSHSSLAANDVHAWLPSTANLLREREHHIAKLEGELAKKDAWLGQLTADHSRLQLTHEETLVELRQRNDWAARLNDEIMKGRLAIAELQGEAEIRLGWIHDLETAIAQGTAEIARLRTEVASRTAWAMSLEEQLDIKTRHVQLQAAEIGEHQEHLNRQSQLLDQHWRRIEHLQAERLQVANSKWLRLGRRLHLGPVLNVEPGQ